MFFPKLMIEQLERRTLLASISWDGGGDGTSWSDKLNWSGDVVPTQSDDVTISVANSSPTIRVSTYSPVRTLTTSENILIAGFLDAFDSVTLQNASVTLGDTTTKSRGTLRFTGSLTPSLGGTGEVDLVTDTSGVICDNFQAARTLTIASGIDIKATAVGTTSVRTGDLLAGEVINHGDIEVSGSGAILNVGGTANSSSVQPKFTNDGTLKSSAGGTLEVAGTWSSTTSLLADDANLWLQGSYSPAMVSSIVRTGTTGTTRLDGDMQLSTAAMTLSATTGSVILNENGYLFGPGNVNTTEGAQLICVGGTIMDATINGEMVLDQFTTRVRGGFILNGTMTSTGGALAGDGGWTCIVTARDGSRLSNVKITGTVLVPDDGATVTFDTLFSGTLELKGSGAKAIALDSQTWTSASGVLFDSPTTSSLLLKSTDPNTPATLSFYGTVSGGGGAIAQDPQSVATTTFDNHGTVSASSSGGQVTLAPGSLTNSGTMLATGGGTLKLDTVPSNFSSQTGTLTGGTWEADAASTLVLPASVSILTNAAAVVLSGAGASFPALTSMTLNTSTLTLAAGAVLSLHGDFAQSSAGKLVIPITGATTKDFGRLVATGDVALDGTLVPQPYFLFTPSSSMKLDIVTGASLSGQFASVTQPVSSERKYLVTYSATTATLGVSAPRPTLSLLRTDDTGTSASDGITNKTQPTFRGAATDATTVNVYIDGALTGTVAVSNGSYSFKPSTPLSEGQHQVTAASVDSDGEESAQTPLLTVTIDTTAPSGSSVSFDPNSTAPIHALSFKFSENVIGSFTTSDIALTNTTTGETVPSSSMQFVTWLTDKVTGVFRFSGYTNGVLPNGWYEGTVGAGEFADLAGNVSVADLNFSFFVLAGDANRNQKVDISDFNLLATNFGKTGKTFSQGDFDYSGTVTILDFNILATNFGKRVDPPTNQPATGFSANSTTPIASSSAKTTLLQDATLTDAPAHERRVLADVL
jgi:hypothetical protein